MSSNAQLEFLHVPLPLSTTSSGCTTMRRYEDHSPHDRNSTTSSDTIVTIPPLVVRIRASSTVFVKASSLVNRDLGAIANMQPETQLTRYRPTGLPVQTAQRFYPVRAQSLGRALRNQKQSDGSLSAIASIAGDHRGARRRRSGWQKRRCQNVLRPPVATIPEADY